MLDVSNFHKGLEENEEGFDVDALPDIEGEGEGVFLDIIQEREKEEEAKNKNKLVLPKEEATFKDVSYTRNGDKLFVRFSISPNDIQNIVDISSGLFSAEMEKAEYEFDVVPTKDENVKELQYDGEYVGEIIAEDVKIYRKYFFAAIIRNLVKQEILLEHEINKFTINPVFFIKLQVHSANFIADISHKGFPVNDVAEYQETLSLEKQAKAAGKEMFEKAFKEKKSTKTKKIF